MDTPSLNPVKVAIVGLGRAGWSIHVEALKDRADFRIIDVADPNEERRAEAAALLGCGTHLTIDGLLAATEAEVVVVATPSHTHEADGLKVLESGRHCILEKPMATSHAGALNLLEAAGRADRKLFVHHQRRFSDEFQFLREIIDSGVLGAVFEIDLAWGGFARRNDWQTLKKNGGGNINNTGPHIVDIALNLVDSRVNALFADVRHVKDAGDADDHAHLFMKTEGGQTIDLLVTTCRALNGPRTVLLGSQGTLQAMDDQKAMLKTFDAASLPKLEVIDGLAPGRKYGNDDVLPWTEEERTMKPTRQIGGFHDNVRAVLRDGAAMVVTAESAAEVLRVIEWAKREGEAT
ncbi:MAG: Gfo/Idh/MocA family oxidoreductase [Opitutaceae bacterium]